MKKRYTIYKVRNRKLHVGGKVDRQMKLEEENKRKTDKKSKMRKYAQNKITKEEPVENTIGPPNRNFQIPLKHSKHNGNILVGCDNAYFNKVVLFWGEP